MFVIALGLILGILGFKFLKFSIKTMLWIMVAYFVLVALVFILKVAAVIVGILLLSLLLSAIYVIISLEVNGKVFKDIATKSIGKEPDYVFGGYLLERYFPIMMEHYIIAEVENRLWAIQVSPANNKVIKAMDFPIGSVAIKVKDWLFFWSKVSIDISGDERLKQLQMTTSKKCGQQALAIPQTA
jgi:Ca2+/Na+ antiporter